MRKVWYLAWESQKLWNEHSKEVGSESVDQSETIEFADARSLRDATQKAKKLLVKGGDAVDGVLIYHELQDEYGRVATDEEGTEKLYQKIWIMNNPDRIPRLYDPKTDTIISETEVI